MRPTAASRPALGAGLMIAAMLVIPIADGIAKQLTGTYAAGFVSWARLLASAALALPVALVTHGGRAIIPRGQLLSQVARAVFLVGAMTSFYAAISRVPLADARGAYFVAPIIASLLAVPVLKERLDGRTLIALTLGFAGTLLVVRPGASMDVGMLWSSSA